MPSPTVIVGSLQAFPMFEAFGQGFSGAVKRGASDCCKRGTDCKAADGAWECSVA